MLLDENQYCVGGPVSAVQQGSHEKRMRRRRGRSERRWTIMWALNNPQRAGGFPQRREAESEDEEASEFEKTSQFLTLCEHSSPPNAEDHYEAI